MEVFSLSKATEEHITDYELYGIFSSMENAQVYAMKDNQNLKIQGVDTINNTDYSYWVIDSWIIDTP